ncbi:MAG TPA: hypothetical protein VJ689_10000 [Gaiellaceae bacterium]|jgi:hypothetical protein|nr:hypothetical protein [Gaiellaceae bacterium]
MSLLATVRPDAWNFPLFLHVLGAMVLIGAAVVGVVGGIGSTLVPDPATLRRLAFRSLLFVALPAYIVMRVGAEWIHEKEFGNSDEDPAWIGIGYITADAGALLLLISLILSGLAARRSSGTLAKVGGVVIAIALAGWVVAVWAMGAKPD